MYDVCTENVYRLSCTLHRIQFYTVRSVHYTENTADFYQKCTCTIYAAECRL